MRSAIFVLVCLVLLVDSLVSPAISQSISPSITPRVGITVVADGKPVNQQNGLQIDTKRVIFKALLDTTLKSGFENFKPELLIKNVEVILVKNSRKIAGVDVENGYLPDKLIG